MESTLGESPEDDAEMLRRWERYSSEMQAIIAAGGVHQDADGWWIDDATGDLIGPDPKLERPRTDADGRRWRSRGSRCLSASTRTCSRISRRRGRGGRGGSTTSCARRWAEAWPRLILLHHETATQAVESPL